MLFPSFISISIILILTLTLNINISLSASVLVFGDSWGVFGWEYLQEMLDNHNTNLTVKSYAIGGTTSTFWSREPNVINELVDLNPDVEYIWLSLGGNDVIDFMPNCTLQDTLDQCADILLPIVVNNTKKILDPVFKNHNNVKLFQFGYDILNLAMNAFCEIVGTEIDYKCIDIPGCINPYFVKIQYSYVDNMPEYYTSDSYTAVNLLGSLQTYGNVSMAIFQHPNLDYWSPKELMMENCIHPNEIGFPVVMENLWEQYFSKFY